MLDQHQHTPDAAPDTCPACVRRSTMTPRQRFAEACVIAFAHEFQLGAAVRVAGVPDQYTIDATLLLVEVLATLPGGEPGARAAVAEALAMYHIGAGG